jgi:malonate decarboxylase gamma subunit
MPMRRDEMLASLFPGGHDVSLDDGLLAGRGALSDGRVISVAGITDGVPLGIDRAGTLAGHVLSALDDPSVTAILMPVDSSSQRMAKRDELLGLNEALAHLAKALRVASHGGRPSVGLLQGGSAAGAFIASALATDRLVALPGAHPAVMDLPSMARVTKLPLALLEDKARETAVFAPGLDNLERTGGIHRLWDPSRPLGDQLAEALADATGDDIRDRNGLAQGGRPRAAAIAERIFELVRAYG